MIENKVIEEMEIEEEMEISIPSEDIEIKQQMEESILLEDIEIEKELNEPNDVQIF